MKKISLFMLSGIIILVLCGCSTDNNENSTQVDDNYQNDQTEEIRDPFIISDEKGYVSDNYWYYIDGTITNTTSTDFTYAEIDYILYDNSGAILTTCYTNINYVEANGVWKYSVHCPMPNGNANNVTTFKMKEYKYNW